jgi:hypothetical protein
MNELQYKIASAAYYAYTAFARQLSSIELIPPFEGLDAKTQGCWLAAARAACLVQMTIGRPQMKAIINEALTAQASQK